MAAAIDLLVSAGVIDSRSRAADERLNYGPPLDPVRAEELLGESSAAIENRRAEERDARELLESGLLFEVNRRVLHPFGLALAVAYDRNYDSHRLLSRLARTEEPEGFSFEPEALSDGYDRLRRFMRSGGYDRLAARYERLGFRSQVPPPVDPFADEAEWGIHVPRLADAARRLLSAAIDVANEATVEREDEPDLLLVPVETIEDLESAVLKVVEAIGGVSDEVLDDVPVSRSEEFVKEVQDVVDDVSTKIISGEVGSSGDEAEKDLRELEETIETADMASALGRKLDVRFEIDARRRPDGSIGFDGVSICPGADPERPVVVTQLLLDSSRVTEQSGVTEEEALEAWFKEVSRDDGPFRVEYMGRTYELRRVTVETDDPDEPPFKGQIGQG
jgi:hypothetical protein